MMQTMESNLRLIKGLQEELQKKGATEAELSAVDVLRIGGQRIRKTRIYKYFGGLLATDADLGVTRDVKARCTKARMRVWGFRALFRSKRTTLRVRRAVLTAIIAPTLLYGASNWAIRRPHLQRLRVC